MQQEAQLSFNYGMGLGDCGRTGVGPQDNWKISGVNEYGMLSTRIALVLNIFIAGLVFRSSVSFITAPWSARDKDNVEDCEPPLGLHRGHDRPKGDRILHFRPGCRLKG